MKSPRSGLVALALAAATVLLAVLLVRGGGTPEPSARVPSATPVPAASTPSRLPATPPGGRAPPEGDEPAAAPSLPFTGSGAVRMPVARKLVADELSSVPHEVIGAWDDAPEAPERGAHRTLVLLVDPNLPTPQLEALARDVSRRHRDAEVLDLRIYDSAVAATEVGARGQELRQRHLVASVVRNDRLDYREMRIHGVAVEP